MGDPNERFQRQFLNDMAVLLKASGLSERWNLNEGETFLYGNVEDEAGGTEPFHWEYGVLLEAVDGSGESMEIYGYDEGSCGVDYEGNYEPYSLNFKKSGFNLYGEDGNIVQAPLGSDEAVFTDAFGAWLDFWYKDWYGDDA